LLLDALVALSVLLAAIALLGQAIVWSLDHRACIEERALAMEEAANVLEAARAMSWASLDDAWAEKQQTLQARWAKKMTVTVERIQDRPGLKRVGVVIACRGRGSGIVPVALSTVLADRGDKEKQP
jgi:microcystin degradation protein MlrC